MEETAKISDEEAVNNQAKEVSDLPAEDANSRPSHVDDTYWKLTEELERERLLWQELELRIPTDSESNEDFNVAWEAILDNNPLLIAPFSQSKDKFLRSWKRSKLLERRGLLEKELRLRTPTDSDSYEDFITAWEAILDDNPSLIAPFSHRKTELLSSWKWRNVPSRRRPRGSCGRFDPSLADGYTYRSESSDIREPKECKSGSRTLSMQPVSVPKSGSPSTNHNSTSQAPSSKIGEVAASPSHYLRRMWKIQLFEGSAKELPNPSHISSTPPEGIKSSQSDLNYQ